MSEPQQHPSHDRVDAVVVGAGLSGMYMLYRLRGLGLATVVLEAGSDVGGTWYWNRYPGARCDVESLFYSYSFSEDLQQDWEWSERYPAQPEILRYAQHVADRFGLRSDIRFDTRVATAVLADDGQWEVTTEAGDVLRATYLVTAVGCLSAAKVPDFPGMGSFSGSILHTGHWPSQEVDFAGKRVGVVGTGSSGIQVIPMVARSAAALTVFQRTANFSIPAHNHPLSGQVVQEVKATYAGRRRAARHTHAGVVQPVSTQSALEVSAEERRRVFDERWDAGGAPFVGSFNDLLLDLEANQTAAAYVAERIASIVRDPEVAERLTPRDHPIGAKRICVDTDYYATYNRDNVSLVDVRQAPIEAVTATGLRAGGVEYPLDVLVLATGFDAMTGPLTRFEIRGRDGLTIGEKWTDGPTTYLGVATSGFPNLFMITGPGSPSVLSNMMVSIEQHVDWITDLIGHLRASGVASAEADAAAEAEWTEHVTAIAQATVYPQANSWYMGANIPGKARVFMPYVGGVGTYRDLCDDVARHGYRGFDLV